MVQLNIILEITYNIQYRLDKIEVQKNLRIDFRNESDRIF